MIGEHGRGGRYHGGGFTSMVPTVQSLVWLADLYGRDGVDISDRDIRERLLSVRLSKR